MPRLDPRTTALVMIDLRGGGRPWLHRAADAVESARELAGRFRRAGAAVVTVHARWTPERAVEIRRIIDGPSAPGEGGAPRGAAEDIIGPVDLVIDEQPWSAFHGTELDRILRRRGVRTIVLGGIATDFGVEATARDAWERGYEVVIAEGAATRLPGELRPFGSTPEAIAIEGDRARDECLCGS